jgi:ADP-heptose:LPS heptosyltransferase
MRIVALVRGGIGNQILFFPTLDDLKRYYPNAQIDTIVESDSAKAYQVNKSVRDVLTFDFKDRNSVADWINLVGIIREREYDVAITTERSWFAGLILWLTGIPTRVGYQDNGTPLLSHSVPLNTKQYAAYMYHDLLKGLGIKSPCPELSINIPLSDTQWAKNEQKRLNIDETGYVLIYCGTNESPNDKIPNEIYPSEYWEQIIQELTQKQADVPVVLVKTSDNEKLARTLAELQPNVKVTSLGNIGQLAAMITGANLLLTNDNTPIQLAIATHSYVIALLASNDPANLLPKSDKFLAIKSPTGKIADVTPKDVFEKIFLG